MIASLRAVTSKSPAFRAAVLLAFATLVMALASPTRGAESPQGPLIFAGSGGNLPLIRLLAEEFERTRPGIKIDVPASIGSTGGIRAAADGAIALGLISRPLRESEKGLGLTVLTYARTAIVIGAHPTVADTNITFEDFVSIHRGIKKRWKDGREIVVLTREPQDSSIEVLVQKIPGFKEAFAESQEAKRWITLYTDQQMNQTLARTPYAIGLSDMGAITATGLSIKVLNVNGVFPLPQNVLSGKYPLVKSLSFVFRKDRVPDGARAFIDFVRSKDGTKIMRANGYLPGE